MTLPAPSLPKYTLTLPATKKGISYRAFSVREEKVLLLAIEEKNTDRMVEALSQIFELCTFGVCKLNEMVQVDAEFLFIHIRNKSLGEGVEVTHECKSCRNKIDITLNLDDIVVQEQIKMDPNIKISDSTIVTLSYPSLDKTMSLTADSDPILAVAKCVEMLTIDNQVYTKDDLSILEIAEYLGNLTQVQIDLLESFFNSMPRITFDTTYNCVKCDTANNIHLEGLGDFFE